MTTADSTWLGAAELAKLIRKELKANFPGQKFSVRSSNYSGGSSIAIRWTDGPTQGDVDLVVEHFQRVSFDGMIDLKEYLGDFEYDGETYRASSWVSTYRSFSETFLSALAAEAEVEAAKWAESELHFFTSIDYSIRVSDYDGTARVVAHSGNPWRDNQITQDIAEIAKERAA